MIIDIHTHFHTEEFDADREEVIKRAAGAVGRRLISEPTVNFSRTPSPVFLRNPFYPK